VTKPGGYMAQNTRALIVGSGVSGLLLLACWGAFQEGKKAQAMVMGDRQSHLIALITLNQEQVREWGEREGLEFHSPEEIASHPRVLALVKEKIRQKNKELAAFEAVRSFRVLPQDLTVEREELTPTLKLRRQVVMERYKELVEEMVRRPRFDL